MKHLLFSFLIVFSPFLFAQSPFEHREASIDSIMRSILIHEGKQPIHNFMLYGHNKRDGFRIHKGLGILGRNETPIEKSYQFKIASITKTFVATIILQLVEEQKLAIDDLVAPYLKDIDFLRFDEFHHVEGKAYADQIRVQHLLRHTSGVADIFTDKETRFVLSVLTHKQKLYDEEKIVDVFFKYRLHKKSHNIPGEGYHYSDMNSMLLGFIIEQITGKSLVTNIRERILEPLNMDNTYFEYYEPAVGIQQQVDTYLNRLNVTQKVKTSHEWAGGGLVSTTEEVARFISALFEMKFFENKETLEMMIDVKATKAFDREAGMGIFRYELNGQTFYGHGGYYGSLMLYSPEEQISLCVNIGQANATIDAEALLGAIVEVLME